MLDRVQTESAFERARRHFWPAVTGDWRAWIVLGLFGLAGAAVGAYLAWDRSREGTVAVTVLAGAAALLGALLVIYAALLIFAPTSQRNLARRELQSALAGDDKPGPFSSFTVGPVWSFDERAGNEHSLVVELRLTNRQADRRVNLDAELFWQFTTLGEPAGVPHKLLRRYGELGAHNVLVPPVDVGPEQTVHGALAFHTMSAVFTVDSDEPFKPYLRHRGTLVFLRLTDHVSAEVLDHPVLFEVHPPGPRGATE